MENFRSMYRIAATFFGLSVVLLFLFLFAVAIASDRREIIACSQFISRSDAQAAYNINPRKYVRLDHDHDGKVCENMK